MNNKKIEHILSSAATIAEVDNIYVFGSNAFLIHLYLMKRINENDDFYTLIKNKRIYLPISFEVDLHTGSQEKDDLVDNTIGEITHFQDTYGIYAHANNINEAFIGLSGWKERLVYGSYPTGTKFVLPDINDIFFSKIYAGRQKDYIICSLVVSFLNIPIKSLKDFFDKNSVDLDPIEKKQYLKNFSIFKNQYFHYFR